MELNKELEMKIKENHYYFQKLDRKLRDNKQIILHLLTINPDIYYLLDSNFSSDIEVITTVVSIKPEIIRDMEKEILLDKKVSKKIFEINPLAINIYEELGIINKVYISSFPKHIFDYLIRLESKKNKN